MDVQVALFSIIPAILAFLLISKFKNKNFPPGPPSWPLIGSMPILFNSVTPLHITLTNMAQTYGPMMTLWLGTQPTVIASTPESAMEILKTHDRACSGRHIRMSFRLKHHIKYSLVWADCTDYWKLLRKIARTEIFAPKMLQAQSHAREEKVGELIEYLGRKQGQAVKINQFVFGTLLNILGSVVFSKNVFEFRDDDGDKESMQNLIKQMLMIGAAPNLAEFYPFLETLDLQGLKRRCDDRFTQVMKFWEGTVKERRERRNEESKDMLDVLLANDFNDSQINALFLETFGPGSETSSATIEWTMAELIKNPKEMAKVRKELDNVVGRSSVKESHLPELPYLQACIKETMRLHPAAPFLLPRRAVESCQIMGYTIPKGCQILVNAYAIGRDPKAWKEPDRFRPERFLETEVDYHGGHFQYIPFGSGRRTCVGMALATRTLPLIVGSLVNTYDWGLPDGKKPEELEMKEMLSLSLAIDPSLLVVPTLRA